MAIQIKTSHHSVRRAFTIVELLTAAAITMFLAGILIVALAQVREDAREMRTKAQIARIDQLLTQRWDSFRTRKVPIVITTTDVMAAGQQRLNALHELMRTEMPDRVRDVYDLPVTLANQTTLQRRFRRVMDNLDLSDDPAGGADGTPTVPDLNAWTTEFQGAECLYLILASTQTEGGSGIDFFREEEIGDTDGDGMPEILDGWKHPIEFIRWPVGLSATRQTAMFDQNGDGINDRSWSAIQHGDTEPAVDGDAGDSPDFYDYLRVDSRWSDGVTTNDPFAIYPLVVSAGPDKIFDMVADTPVDPFRYSTTSPPNDPFVEPVDTSSNPLPQIGEPLDADADDFPDDGYFDNINNHTGLAN